MDAEDEEEDGEIKPEREKTDAGRTLLHEARQAEGGASFIKRVALVPPGQTINPKSIMESILEMMKFFVNDPAGAAHAAVHTIIDVAIRTAQHRCRIS